MRRAARVFSLLALGTLAACSSVSLRPWGENPNQTIEVTATDTAGMPRTGLHCRLGNDKGAWQVDVPGKVEVARSSLPLRIDCNSGEGMALPHTEIDASDARKERAVQSAKKFSLLGVAGTIAFLGAFAVTPAAIVDAVRDVHHRRAEVAAALAELRTALGAPGAAGRAADLALTLVPAP